MKKRISVLALVGILTSSTAYGSGFAVIEQSVSGLGNAFAGGAAIAEDATSIFFNPAGITRLDGKNVIAASNIIIPQAEFKNQSSTHATTAPLIGGNGGNGGETALVPNLYYSTDLNNDLSIGVGVGSPFGLVTEYDESWVGRYHAVRSDVMTVNINPSVAYKISDKLSVGGGVNVMYIDAELSSMVDFGGGALRASEAASPGSSTVLMSSGILPQAQDGKAVVTGDDWGYGFNLGVLYEVSDSSRVGAAFRSEVDLTLSGNADFTVPISISNLPGGLGAGIAAKYADTNIGGEISMPASASVSMYHRLNKTFALMADISWMDWSSFDELRIKYDNPLLDDSVTIEEWEDSWRYSLGGTMILSESLLLRVGLAYDETPISDERRTPRVPGEDRFWTSFGIGYLLSDSLSCDAAYSHLFISDSKIALTSADNGSYGYLTGEFENSVDIISAQLKYDF